jgi:hypothetical protein
MTVTEKNKQACLKLVIPWHEEDDCSCMYKCSCGLKANSLSISSREFIKKHIKESNPDFTTKSGRIELLEIMKEKDLLLKFLFSILGNWEFANRTFIPVQYMTEKELLLDAVLKFKGE